MWSKVRNIGWVNSHQQVSHYVEPLPHKKKNPYASSFLSMENSTNDFASRKVLMVKKKLREKNARSLSWETHNYRDCTCCTPRSDKTAVGLTLLRLSGDKVQKTQ